MPRTICEIMPIFIDASERATTSRLPHIPGEIVVNELEALTGADLIISEIEPRPFCDALVTVHARAGSVFVQRKSGGDVVSSIGDRLNTSLAKMNEIPFTNCGQRVLLVTGHFEATVDGGLVIGNVVNRGKSTPFVKWGAAYGHANYRALVSALTLWGLRGGVNLIPLGKDDDIVWWAQDVERHLIAAKHDPIKHIYEPLHYPDDPPLPSDVIQLPRRVTDFRRALSAMPGVGVKMANAVWEAAEMDPIIALCMLTDNKGIYRHPPRWGKGKRDKLRKWLKMGKGIQFYSEVSDECD